MLAVAFQRRGLGTARLTHHDQALLTWKQSRWPQETPSSPTTAPEVEAQPVAASETAASAPSIPPTTSRTPFIPPGARSFPARAVVRPPPRGGVAARDILAPKLSITATDPFTSPAYRARTGLPCLEASFADVAAGLLPPPDSSNTDTSTQCDPDEVEPYDIVIISFALHLVESSSELWTLLTELSKRAKWLCVTAPHKKPDVRSRTGCFSASGNVTC